jgi:hypothetical protein
MLLNAFRISSGFAAEAADVDEELEDELEDEVEDELEDEVEDDVEDDEDDAQKSMACPLFSKGVAVSGYVRCRFNFGSLCVSSDSPSLSLPRFVPLLRSSM